MVNKIIEKKYPKPMSTISNVFWIGLFGGIFWTLIGYIAYLFSLTEIRPNIILEPWALGDWKKGWLGTVISIVLIGIFSVGASFIYYVVLKKLKGIWPGMGFGVLLFFFVFLLLNPLFPDMDPFLKINRDTMITSVCLYIVYGIFIGYSISYEFQNQIVQDKEPVT
ncbi:MAG TPA: YqhR family membrane protein [Bacillales bacterium]|nr:YqhR family membrane protein [Bacillales bacterium]